MKNFTYLVILFLLLPIPVVAANCTQQELPVIVQGFGSNDASQYLNNYKCLAEYPHESAKILVGQLHVVKENKIRQEDTSKYVDTMRVIWSLRGLRYLTGGMDFTAKSATPMDKLGNAHKNFLTMRREDQLTFFGTAMSHETTYIAPKDVQEKVIQQWQDWYRSLGNTFSFKEPQSLEDWYY